MRIRTWTKSLWWLIHKDVLREYRARVMLPSMMLLGVVLALVLQMQLDLAVDTGLRMTSGSFWIAVFFAGTLALDRSIADEREHGCWEALRLFPVSPARIYLSKVVANVLALSCLELVLAPVILVVSNHSASVPVAGLLLVATLGNISIAALGTLLSALTRQARELGQLLTLLLLPMALPVLLAASEATRLLLLGRGGPECSRWIHLLGAAAVLFLTAGMLVFDHVVEE